MERETTTTEGGTFISDIHCHHMFCQVHSWLLHLLELLRKSNSSAWSQGKAQNKLAA